MKFAVSVALVAASLAPLVAGQDEQIVFDLEHNASSIIGTWSSGSRAVSTGPKFANPANKSFTYPKNAGVSYSFDENYNYEVARYRFVSNATNPNCITGVVNWHHGKYSLLNNGSIVLRPFGDGYQQVQDPCPEDGVSNFIEDYNNTELYRNWRIFNDVNTGFKLHLFQYDGAPLAPMFQVAPTPVMNPTKLLRNVTPPAAPSDAARSFLTNPNAAPGGEQQTLMVRFVLVFAGVLAAVAVL